MVQLALYRPHKWWDIGGRLVCFWTKSEFSHCEVVVDGECYSSSIRDGGVRAKYIDLHQRHWEVFDLPWADAVRVKLLYQETRKHRYGWLDLIGSQFFNARRQDSGKWFCSEWCAAALGFSSPEIYSPGLLGDACRMKTHVSK